MQTIIDRTKQASVIEAARRAKAASAALARASSEDKDRALLMIAEEIELKAEEIFAANRRDLDRARTLVEAGQMAESLRRRLKLDQRKLAEITTGIKQVAALDDPVGKVSLARELDEGLNLYRINCPVGVIGVIFESRPDALAQIASLAIKSGNGLLLKGGKEAEHSNRALFNVIRNAALKTGLPSDWMCLLETREDVLSMLKADGLIDLIIPRGSNSLVRFVQENTAIPVLGHSEGICHIYVDRAADVDKAINITLDSKAQYPAACNAVETLLVHREVAGAFLPALLDKLRGCGVKVRLDEQSIVEYGMTGVEKATEEDWRTEYSDLVLAVKVVDGIKEAIRHINTYSSHHTDSMITEDLKAFERFFAEVDSAGVYLNASTRFADGFRYGFGAEVGISTGKLHPRGPVGLEGLVTYKYKLMGAGHTVAMYSGDNARRFTHRLIESS
jgi:glutamate-5-semialdehyde dehydrogenase